MEVDFSQPQRQSSIGILVVFFYSLQKYLRAIWPILIVYLLKINQNNSIYFILGTLFLLLFLALVSYLKFINFTFYINTIDNEFVIQEGIFNKTITTIALDKIQQININQSFIQKLVGVYELAFDTAGSNKKEGSIKAISHDLALALKSKLLENEPIDKSEINNLNENINLITNEKVIKIDLLSLIKIGITSNYVRGISLLLLLVATIFDNVIKFTNTEILDDQNIEAAVENNFNITAVSIFIIVLLVVVIVINLVTTIFKYFDLSISKQKGSLVLSHGLLNSKSTIIKPEKVQIVYAKQNYFQKKLNVLELEIKQAAAIVTNQPQKSKIVVPGCNETEKNQIFQLLYNDLPTKGVLLLPNYRKLIFSIFIFVVFPLILFVIIANFLEPKILQFINYAIVYSIIIPTLQIISFKNYKLFIHNNFIIKQSGLWDITTEIIEPQKIQSISTSQLFWHQKHNIGSINIYTAGGKLSFDLANFEILSQKINWWLYNIEKSQKQGI